MSHPVRSARLERVGPQGEAWRWNRPEPAGTTGALPAPGLRRKLLLPGVLAAIVALVVGAAVAFAVPVSYTATAESFVSPAAKTATESDPFAGSTFVLQRIETYSGLATSSPVLLAALQQVGTDMTLEHLRSEVTAQNLPRSVLLSVTVTDRVPQRAADLANAVSAQQARAIETLEGTEGRASAPPVRVTPVTVAPVPPRKSSTHRGLTGALAGLGAGAVVFAAGVALAYRRLRRAPRALAFLASLDREGS